MSENSPVPHNAPASSSGAAEDDSSPSSAAADMRPRPQSLGPRFDSSRREPLLYSPFAAQSPDWNDAGPLDAYFLNHAQGQSHNASPQIEDSTATPKALRRNPPSPDASLLSKPFNDQPAVCDSSSRVYVLSQHQRKTTADTPPPSSPDEHHDIKLRHLAQLNRLSEHIPDHIVALPPLSSPVATPFARPATPSREPNIRRSSDERSRYRSWREGKPTLGRRLMEASGREDGKPFLDKAIEATLPRAEQSSNARSRKTTHVLGLFRENDAAQDRGKGKRRRDETEVHDGLNQRPALEDNVTSSETGIPLRQRSLRRLSASNDLRPTGVGNNTEEYPSKALRTLESSNGEREWDLSSTDGSSPVWPTTTKNDKNPSSPSVEVSLEELDRQITLQPERRSDPGIFEQTHDIGSESPKYEESAREHISAAVYIPYRALDQQGAVRPRGSSDTEKEAIRDPPDPRTLRSPQLTQRSASPNDPHPSEIEFSIHSEDENQLFHGDVALSKALSEESGSQYQPSVPSSVIASESESEYSEGGEEGEGENYAPGTATPKADTKFFRTERESAAQQAIVLKPFRHQVGGHTALYHFSRRAVCKKLNNKENKFYETVERFHPELLEFLPRYIGVLNVTFEKTSKTKRNSVSNENEIDRKPGFPNSSDRNTLSARELGLGRSDTRGDDFQPRIVSHSQGKIVMPEVYLNMNRHIIPGSLYSYHGGVEAIEHQGPYNFEPMATRPLDASHLEVDQGRLGHMSRPAPHHHASWGATIVNRDLREQVMREVFAPPTIHRPRKRFPGRSHFRSDGTESSLGSTEATSPVEFRRPGIAALRPKLDSNSQVGETEKSKSFIGLHKSLSAVAPRGDNKSRQEFNTSALPPKNAGSTTKGDNKPGKRVRRRHSGSGLRRKQHDLDSNDRGDLKFYDEDDFAEDEDEGMFSMDDEMTESTATSSVESRQSSISEQGSAQTPRQEAQKADDLPKSPGTMLPAPLSDRIEEEPEEEEIPQNPKEARLQAPQRVEEFLLLEDLTAGMINPCTLDLKMGTRQYGLDADEGKQKSQRRKAKSTTSRELGLRVCGMQTYDVNTNQYVWKDKYWGRDLKAGKEFQDALASYFYDGKDYNAAKRFIPTALEQITALEKKIRSLPGYRFYGSSLYIIYDRGAGDERRSTLQRSSSSSNIKELGEQKEKGGILFKIIDFANCVSKEATNLTGVACPPAKPDDIDKGYLRGLRSLTMYFKRIWKEANRDSMERNDSDAASDGEKDWAGTVDEEDDGDVSV